AFSQRDQRGRRIYHEFTPDEMTPSLVVRAYGEALVGLLRPGGDGVGTNRWPGVEGADALPLKARALLDELGGRLTDCAWNLFVLEEPERTQTLALLEEVQALDLQGRPQVRNRPTPTPDDWPILFRLAKLKETIKISDLAADLNCDRSKLGKNLVRLERM